MHGTLDPDHDHPRARLLRSGAGALGDAELLGLLLRGRAADATRAAQALLSERGGLAGLLHTSADDLRRLRLTPSRHAAVLALLELARRLARARLPRRRILDQPELVAEYLQLRYSRPGQEVLGALYLDVQNRLVGERELFRGALFGATVEPRAILKAALARDATGIVLFHTHPGGDPAPSSEDLGFTLRMAEASEILGIRLLDHMILGEPGRWTSLRRCHGAWSLIRRRRRRRNQENPKNSPPFSQPAGLQE